MQNSSIIEHFPVVLCFNMSFIFSFINADCLIHIVVTHAELQVQLMIKKCGIVIFLDRAVNSISTQGSFVNFVPVKKHVKVADSGAF